MTAAAAESVPTSTTVGRDGKRYPRARPVYKRPAQHEDARPYAGAMPLLESACRSLSVVVDLSVGPHRRALRRLATRLGQIVDAMRAERARVTP